jgi:tRNA pseudouridine38-40 synthase
VVIFYHQISFTFALLKIRLDIAYNGTNYCGWQKQENAITVQQTIEDALSKILRSKIFVVGCGRTDTGVHALHYVLDFEVGQVPFDNWIFRLNQVLPDDIAAHQFSVVSDDFHSRFDALSRTYLYKISLKKNPFLQNMSYYLWKAPNLDLMNNACEILKNNIDFEAFCKKGSNQKSTICYVSEAKWLETPDGLEFTITANRFLRNMVRAIVGTLIEVGYGNITISAFQDIINAKDRKRAGKSAPARGLYLQKICY